jgi:hypothetical protein
MDAAAWTVLGTVLGGAIGLIGTSVQARNARKIAQITAENQARTQSEKLRHDAVLGEIAFKRAKLEELNQAVACATAYCGLSVAIFRRADAPTLEQQLGRYNQDRANIDRARIISELYFDSITGSINKLTGIIEHYLHNNRSYFVAEPESDSLQIWTRANVELERELCEVQNELSWKISEEAEKIAKEASRLSVVEDLARDPKAATIGSPAPRD